MLSPADVLAALAPVDPDRLHAVDVTEQRFEALWSPINRNDVDVQRLRRHPNCQPIGAAYEPRHLPGWIAVQFRFSSHPTRQP